MALMGAPLAPRQLPGPGLTDPNGAMRAGHPPMQGGIHYFGPGGSGVAHPSEFAPSQPNLFHFLAAAAGAHPAPGTNGARRGAVAPPSLGQEIESALPPAAHNYAQFLPLLRALGGSGAIPNPNLNY